MKRILLIIGLAVIVNSCGLLALNALLDKPDAEKITEHLTNGSRKWKHDLTIKYKYVVKARKIIDTVAVDTIYFKSMEYKFNDDKGKGNFRSGSRKLENGGSESFEWGVDQYGKYKQRLELYFPTGGSPTRIEKYTVRYWKGKKFRVLYQPPGSSSLEFEHQSWTRK
ncbi:MAG: hypothetical protein GXO77_08715 [Calditrichaeota bacterium]|nr:hypothetical protein [Calditrichota bacterium]